jgi:hypothetical protein
VQLSRPHPRAILRLALAAGRDDLDGMINGMYELGMIDPRSPAAEIREAAAEILASSSASGSWASRRAQEMIRDIMDTFYTWPLMLPRELVYFFRAAALLEGIGFRYDPAFNGLETVRPVIRGCAASCCRPPRGSRGDRPNASWTRSAAASTPSATCHPPPSARSSASASTPAMCCSSSASSCCRCAVSCSASSR